MNALKQLPMPYLERIDGIPVRYQLGQGHGQKSTARHLEIISGVKFSRSQDRKTVLGR